MGDCVEEPLSSVAPASPQESALGDCFEEPLSLVAPASLQESAMGDCVEEPLSSVAPASPQGPSKRETMTPELCKMLQSQDLKIARLQQEVLRLQAENARLNREVNDLLSRQLTLNMICKSKKDCAFYTGMSDFEIFEGIYDYLAYYASRMEYWGINRRSPGEKKGRSREFEPKEEFFMVLVRLRTGMSGKEIARNFGISEGHFSRVFATWINFLHRQLKALTRFPTCEELQGHLPAAFFKFPDTRVILDGTEVRIERASSLAAQRQTFSSYKHYNTFKEVVGCAPDGYISFVSDLWGGSSSDRVIVEKSGLLEQLQPGDAIMVDKGFKLNDLPPGVRVHIPCFRKPGEPQMAENELSHTRHVASARVIVERAIGRIKQFHILDRPFPITMMDLAE
ncbi:uncharacterized protein LOC115320941 isoform X1 [Ixodes scapularis]|uniref:uncharacterized protein LOC115320941 isoform X1 n=1 Tax=Ixodes scapularis TaxID=6945 RepID=UPI001A9DFBFD|nr:uncharacterized protein LOC115320941 isoform X1 [Ixodes scapularis]